MRRYRIAIIVGISLVLLTTVLIVGRQWFNRALLHWYFSSTYEPQPLTTATLVPAPDSWMLVDTPWIATDLPVCQSTSLQMIAAHHGNLQPRPAIDWLMAFTYGFSALPDSAEVTPFGQDPEIGLRVAAPYLGLQRRYYTTDDPDLWLTAARSFIAQGYPVRVALDMGQLYGANEPIPHSDVLAGYDQQGFFVYETVCVTPANCQPGHHQAGETGLYVTNERVLAAMEAHAAAFGYPWRYNLTIFLPTTPSTDIEPVWQQIARVTLGNQQYGPPTGLAALEQLIVALEHGHIAPQQIRDTFATTARLRRENATFLRESFATEPDIVQAATYLAEAATYYEQASTATEPSQIAALLRHAATAERAFGETIQAYAP